LQQPVASYELVPQRSRDMQSNERKERVREVPVKVLGGMKDRAI